MAALKKADAAPRAADAARLAYEEHCEEHGSKFYDGVLTAVGS